MAEGRSDDADIPVLLVAYDGGAMSEAQVRMACRAANDLGAIVRVVHVIEVPGQIPLTAPIAPDRQAEIDASLARAERIAEKHRVRCDIVVVTSRSVSESVLAEARESHARLIFVGLRERRRPGATLLLSRTLRHILRNAPCPVQIGYLPVDVPEQHPEVARDV